MGGKTLKIVIVCISLLMLFASCQQSCFDIITHNDMGYWSRYWTPEDPHGSIAEFSKKDSTWKDLSEDWTYNDFTPSLWGLKFRITNDTLFKYINRKGEVIMYDSFPIVSYSKNTIIFKDNNSGHVKWHRLSTKLAKRAIDLMNPSSQVNLITLLNSSYQDGNITDIVDITWKFYGYGDISTGMVRKSEFLTQIWTNLIRFYQDGTMIGGLKGSIVRGKYTISNHNIVFLSFDRRIHDEIFDDSEFCDALPQCKSFKMTNNWLQLFYNDEKQCLIFKISNSTKISKDSQ